MVAEYLAAHIEAQQVRDACVVTLPFETIDRRWVDVFIEPRAADFYLIHDGGKAVNELILQGMKITPAVEREFVLIASRFSVSYADEMFQSGAKISRIAEQVYAVGMASALAMTHLLEHVPMVQEETVEEHVGEALRKWGRNKAKVTENVRVQGHLKQHEFDFLVSPRHKGSPIAVSVLHPTAGPLAAAERFGFKANDLSGTNFGSWRKMAIEVKSEIWSADARRIVDASADIVVPIRSGEPAEYHQITDALDRVA
jgi:hypothetical protein